MYYWFYLSLILFFQIFTGIYYVTENFFDYSSPVSGYYDYIVGLYMSTYLIAFGTSLKKFKLIRFKFKKITVNSIELNKKNLKS